MGLFNFKPKEKALTTAATWVLNGGIWTAPDDKAETYINKGYKALPNLYGVIALTLKKSSIVPFEILEIKNQAKAYKYQSQMKNISSGKDYFKTFKTKEEAFEVVEGTELENLLLNPNDLQNTTDFFEALDGYFQLTGNMYCYGSTPGVGRNAIKPQQLHVIPSPTVEIVAGKGLNKIDGYKVSYFNEVIEREKIGHAKYFNPILGTESYQNSLYGMSPLMACRGLIGRYASADIAQGSMFKNMGPAGLLTGGKDTQLTEQQARAVQDKFIQYHTGEVKAGQIMVTPAELRWEQIGLSPVDLNISEGKQEILGEICNIYHVPIGLFSDKNSTDNNLENSRKILITDGVMPVVEKRKNMLNSWLAPKFDKRFYINFKYEEVFSELEEDMSEKSNWVHSAFTFTPNEMRSELGKEPIKDPNMDKVYIPSNLVSIEDVGSPVNQIDQQGLEDNGLMEE